ncbi:MAG TPA: CADD family putative folate metabolism protein [Candidatus Binataceae bacterium]|jgi:pyrroloquinoline-quinone synthase|nr:CADD family putative folate metabolism protein [Candidatus Binataceae bacterium]
MRTIIDEIDQVVAGRALLNHPFYQAWTAGTLSREALRDYAAQYYRHVEAFPRYLSAVHSRCDDRFVRQALLENLIEEERGPRNHPELWLRFAESLGVSRSEVQAATPRPTTEDLVTTFHRLAREGSVADGLAALYVYESQMPAVSVAKIDGLRRFYGFVNEDSYAFFSVHREADVDHSRTIAGLLERSCSSRVESDVVGAARQAAEALWSMLDGIPLG